MELTIAQKISNKALNDDLRIMKLAHRIKADGEILHYYENGKFHETEAKFRFCDGSSLTLRHMSHLETLKLIRIFNKGKNK